MPWITRPKASTTTPGASFRPPTPTPPTGLNQRTEYAYDARGLTLTVIEAAGTPLALTTVHTYDTLGRVTQSTVDPTGLARSATYEYDLNNRLIRQTGPDGIRTAYQYNADGNRTDVIVADGPPHAQPHSLTYHAHH